ncbi:uncharacterized protein LOC111387404 [Olea europaea subsp. europaea]|uniref:Uncharacterized protein LOC111387404 n=1 Tax=Olea europaea subsp. europaea TaxID=158383 RepID=A0A8S0R8S8_OLEEU|nr:uncharacterized protein LOC111387404 [Olea europaea subsp. europaea]
MSAFVKKLVEKASLKKPVGFSDNIKPDDVNPRLVFHYGIPTGSMLLAYDSIQQILAIATKDGRIKLFGKNGSQVLLESLETVPSKFLLFIENQGVLLNINVNNHIEVWDVDRKCLSYVHNFEKEITSFVAMQHFPYLYAGDYAGTVSVLRLDQEQLYMERMKYHIPLSASHGKTNEVESDIAVNCVLPQPAAESKRVLIIYSDGVITLWAIQESKAIFTAGGTTLQSLSHETKKVTAACWACPIGSKVVVGYSNGDIFIWSVPCPLNSKTERAFKNEQCSGQSAPVCKLNLGYRADKIPISTLKWVDIDGTSGRLYVLGSSDHLSANLLQISCTPPQYKETHHSIFDFVISTNELFYSLIYFDLILQSDNDFSLTGVPLTALYFAYDSRILISGDQSGMVRIYKLKSEPFAPQSSFLSLQGISKKGNNNIIRSIKLVKVNGAVLSIHAAQNLKQIAVGSDQGYVSLIDPEGPSILYQRHIPSELSTGIISTHFETSKFHGFEKNILMVATKDSSVLALEGDTGNTLSSSVVRPKKPSRALFMQILGGQGGSGRGYTVSDGVGINNVNLDDAILLLCAEKAVYVYSLLHVVQGTKKVHYKKKFHSSSCCWASTFCTPNDGLILLFSDGKIQIRSLPELFLLKETSVNGLTLMTSKASSISDNSVSSSHDGELIVVNGDQELFFLSIFLRMETYRLLDPASQVFNKDLVNTQVLVSLPSVKEKKKGIFSSVSKENKGTKSKNGLELEAEDSRKSVEELPVIFAAANFPTGVETETKIIDNDEDDGLDIDDIDIEDPKEKTKGHPMMEALNRQNIRNKFQAIKGKLKQAKVKNDRTAANEEPQEEKAGTAVDQIKKRYGYVSSGESSVANMAKTKLSENLKKLQGINLKTNEMQDTAQSFSSMAKEVLRIAETDKKGS